mmetsp:Transcript_31319/g.66649  ORF Transcript_31319/g.66649 Transcript_31319/m.66649 type:complete len:307 (-) Transcript_31319:425-1345(-)
MTSERKRTSVRTLTARVQSFLYANKKFSFVFSLLLVILLYSLSSDEPSSPYVAKRFGLGAGDTKGELKAALKRKGDGRAAVAIIRVVGMNGDKDANHPKANDAKEDVQYLVQVKSHDYPIEAFQGTVCLLGGNANAKDVAPFDTLVRELKEELHDPEWADEMDPSEAIDDSRIQRASKPFYNSSAAPLAPGTVRYLGTTLHFQSSDLLGKKHGGVPYAFLCALYEITLEPHQLPPSAIYPRGANIQEGRVVLLTEDQLIKHSKYAWGYEYTIEKYFGRKTRNKQRGTAVSEVDEGTWKETTWTPAK